MRVVELLGLPGSGKSTLAGRLVEEREGFVDLESAVLRGVRRSGRDGVSRIAARVVRSPRSPIWRSAYARSSDRFSALAEFCSDHPDLLAAVGNAQSERRERDLRPDLSLGWLLNLMARYQIAVQAVAPGETLVIDEGFCQRAVALFGYGFEPEDEPGLVRYLETVPRPDAVVLVDVSSEEARSRLDVRGWSERVGDDRAAASKLLAGSSQVVDRVVGFLGDRVLSVDGTLSPAETTETVRRLLAAR